MTSQQTAIDWRSSWAALREMDGDEWDTECARLDSLWKGEYRQAFVAYALSRNGWTRENAQVWADEIVDDALIAHALEPSAAARADVEMCEAEASEIDAP